MQKNVAMLEENLCNITWSARRLAQTSASRLNCINQFRLFNFPKDFPPNNGEGEPRIEYGDKDKSLAFSKTQR
jgi:hypothetical protein